MKSYSLGLLYVMFRAERKWVFLCTGSLHFWWKSFVLHTEEGDIYTSRYFVPDKQAAFSFNYVYTFNFYAIMNVRDSKKSCFRGILKRKPKKNLFCDIVNISQERW